ncbi:hypothetical protein ACL02T_09635 [Pseudonocardia sp. RS010]|uniref:hypothetical protein n=1 Tax=Pseudonocardia sp. RS010 TaxID=3385979 RepID=UPI0039A1E7ED
MNTMKLLRQLHAADTGHAVPNRSKRHAHLADEPLIVCAYHLANEPGALIGLVYGTDPAAPHVVAMGNPLNRDVRFAALADFARDALAYLDPYTGYEVVRPSPRSNRATAIAYDTPQIVTPNTATAAWLGDVLARSIRYLRPDEQNVDPALPLLGAHLTAMTQAAHSPLSSLVASATNLLSSHWVTGQLGGETEILPTILRWITPVAGLTGRESAAIAEQGTPPAGPVPGIEFDDALYRAWDQWSAQTAAGLNPLEASEAMRAALLAALVPTYAATFEALELLRGLPPATSDAARHEIDREAWGRHCQRAQGGNARFRALLDPLTAARIMQDSETQLATYTRQQVLDDPLALEELVFTSDAVQGEVLAVNPDIRDGRAWTPLITVLTAVPYENAPGARLYPTTNDRQSAEVIAVDGDTVTLKLRGGMGQGRPTPDRLPVIGQSLTFIALEAQQFRGRTLPRQLPWTHRTPEPVDA